jgi:hypothetical protein
MSARAMTRRTLLAMSAGAIAGGLTRPGGALAALAGTPPPRLEERWIGRLGSAGATIELSRVSDLLGVEWQGPAEAAIELRFRGAGGRWSAWASAAAHGHGPETLARTGRVVGDPVWTGGTSAVQLRSARPLTGVRLHLIDVSDGVGARRRAQMLGPLASPAALALASPVLAAGAGQPPIIARRGWAQGISPPRVTPAYGAVQMAFVHHTENPNGYGPGEVPAMLRAIYVFHRYVNGWNDIGYNFVVDLYGRVFEARAGGIDEPVIGAHAGGYNLVSTGVAVLGSFMSAPISPPARHALERLLAWKLSLHGLPAEGTVTVKVNPAGASYSRFPANARVPLPRIAGHRDGDSTDCPGDVLYGELPSIRARVRGLAPRPARATLALTRVPSPAPAAPATAPQSAPSPPASPPPASSLAPAHSGEPTLIGTLMFLDGPPIAGAQILLQARAVASKGELVRESTLAEALTDTEGRWSLSANLLGAPAGALWLRALCTGSSGVGAAVSDPLHVAASDLTPAPAAGPGTPIVTPPAALPPTAPAAAPPAQ